MKTIGWSVVLVFFACAGFNPGARAADEGTLAKELAEAVVKASGGDNWAKVKTIDFTFNVAQGEKILLSATHHWDMAANTDAVSWAGKTATADLANPPTAGAEKEAFQRWTNDSYWLLAPLKLFDHGVTLSYGGTQQVEGKSYVVLHLQFQGVGLTPGDSYNLYIDPESKLISRWDYMPKPEKKVNGTWGDYKDFGGLKLSVDRHFGDKHIYFSDVAVKTE